MKNFKIIYLILFLIITSCSSSDDLDENNAKDITGVWNLSDYSSQIFWDEVGEYIKRTGDNIDYTIEFKENPKVINLTGEINYLEGELIIGEIIDSSGIIDGELGEGHHTQEWEIVNGNLITKSSFFISGTLTEWDEVTEIIELTSNSMTLRIDHVGSQQRVETILKYTR